MMAEQEQPRRQSIFKIISLTKHRPIFLYKLTDPAEPSEEKGSDSLARMRKVKEEMQKAAAKMNIVPASHRPAFLSKRSESCDLSGKSKGKTERAEGTEINSRVQRSIKEYLRIAYRRAELDRKSSNKKLPAISGNPEYSKSPQNWNELQREYSKRSRNENKSVGPLRKSLRRRPYEIVQGKQQADVSFKPDAISGWEDDPSPEDF